MTASKKWTVQIIDADRFDCSICGRKVGTRGGYALHRGQYMSCPSCARRYPKGKRLAALIITWETFSPLEIDLDDLPEIDLDSLNLDELFKPAGDPLTPRKKSKKSKIIKKGKLPKLPNH